MLKRAGVATTLGTGRVVYLEGSVYEQGRQLGAAAADLIAENARAASALLPDVSSGFDLAAYTAMTRRNAHSADEALEMMREQPRVTGINMKVADTRKPYALCAHLANGVRTSRQNCCERPGAHFERPFGATRREHLPSR